MEAVKEEVKRLKQAGAIKESFYPDWLANTVVMQKKNGKWSVCIDFTDLNQACMTDPFHIPRIDQLVDATVGHPRMSFFFFFYYMSSKGITKYLWPSPTKRRQLSEFVLELPLSCNTF